MRAEAERDGGIRKMAKAKMVLVDDDEGGIEGFQAQEEELELECVDVRLERWRSMSEDSQGSEAKIAPPPVPLKKDRRRGLAGRNGSGGHCRCNCRALDFEQVRALLEGTWIGSMAGPSGERRKGDAKG